MRVCVNGNEMTIEDGCSVMQLLQRQGSIRGPCAVEVNRQVVPKHAHSEHRLAEGDCIEIVTLVGGG
jgi:sulfur carrier protein